MTRRPPGSTPLYSSAASDVYKRQDLSSGDADLRILQASVLMSHSLNHHMSRLNAAHECKCISSTQLFIYYPQFAAQLNSRDQTPRFHRVYDPAILEHPKSPTDVIANPDRLVTEEDAAQSPLLVRNLF